MGWAVPLSLHPEKKCWIFSIGVKKIIGRWKLREFGFCLNHVSLVQWYLNTAAQQKSELLALSKKILKHSPWPSQKYLCYSMNRLRKNTRCKSEYLGTANFRCRLNTSDKSRNSKSLVTSLLSSQNQQLNIDDEEKDKWWNLVIFFTDRTSNLRLKLLFSNKMYVMRQKMFQ